MSTTSFLHALEQAEVLARQALPTVQHERFSCAVALVKAGQVRQADDHAWYVASTTKPDYEYRINGQGCTCEDATYRAPKGQCKHVLATLVARKTLVLMQEPPAPVEPASTEEVPPPPAGIAQHHIVMIHNKPLVKFAGLLQLAHERGLISLSADWMYSSSREI